MGRDKLAGMVDELRNVGAVVISPRRLTRDDIAALCRENPGKKYFVGQVYGQDWVLVSPGDWVSTEFSRLGGPRPPENPGDGNPVSRESRLPVEPCPGKSAAKNNKFTDKQRKEQQHPACQAGPVAVAAFFGAIEGQAGPLVAARELLAGDLSGASQEQARWAGLAWAQAMGHGNIGNPVGLARKLARMAAAGEVSPPAAAVQAAREESKAAAAAAGEAARQAALRASAEAVMRDIRARGASGGGRGKGNLLDILKPHPPAP